MTHFARPLLLTLALALAAFLAPGCGGTEIDDAATADTVEQYLENSIGQKVSSVECPSGVEVESGETFSCEARLEDGATETVTLKILNEDADIEVAKIQPDKSTDKSAK